MTETTTLTVPEAAERLRKDPETIRRYIRQGYIQSARVGREYRIPVSEITRLLTPEPAAKS